MLCKKYEIRGWIMKIKVETETIIGAIASLIAVVAIVIGMAINQFTTDAIWSGIKDISTTLVAIIVLIVAVRKLSPKRTNETFESVLKNELDSWVNRSAPLIYLATDYDKPGTRYYMLTNMDSIFNVAEMGIDELKQRGSKNSGTFNGRFIELPQYSELNKKSAQFTFYLNATTFSQRAKANGATYEVTLVELANKITTCINAKFKNNFTSNVKEKGTQIIVTTNQPLNSLEDARTLVKLIEYVMTLYTIAS